MAHHRVTANRARTDGRPGQQAGTGWPPSAARTRHRPGLINRSPHGLLTQRTDDLHKRRRLPRRLKSCHWLASVTMCHKCATGPPLRGGSGSVRSGPKSLTCTNTPGAVGLEPTTCGLKMNTLPIPQDGAQKCAIWPFSRTTREGMKADPKPVTSTNACGPRRARTDDLRIKRSLSGSLVIVDSRVNRWYCSRERR